MKFGQDTDVRPPRTPPGLYAPEVREVDGVKVHFPRVAKSQTWMDLFFAAWFLGWGCGFVATANWAGWLMLPLAVAFGWLGIWKIVWQWRSDVELARLDGQAMLLARLTNFPKHPLT